MHTLTCTAVPGTTGDFNIAFSHGGQQGESCRGRGVHHQHRESFTGIAIDHWAVIDFAGFEDMVNALGGVPMCIPEKIVSAKAKLRLEPGVHTLSGKQGSGLARMRTAEVGDVSGSDLQRIARQHALAPDQPAILSKNPLTDVGELTEFMKATASSLTMDPVRRHAEPAGSRFGLRNIDPSAIKFHTVPWSLRRTSTTLSFLTRQVLCLMNCAGTSP